MGGEAGGGVGGGGDGGGGVGGGGEGGGEGEGAGGGGLDEPLAMDSIIASWTSIGHRAPGINQGLLQASEPPKASLRCILR